MLCALTDEEPAVAVTVAVEGVQLPVPVTPVNPLGVATTRPAGSVSVKESETGPVSGTQLTLKVSDVVPFSGMLAALKALVKVT